MEDGRGGLLVRIPGPTRYIQASVAGLGTPLCLSDAGRGERNVVLWPDDAAVGAAKRKGGHAASLFVLWLSETDVVVGRWWSAACKGAA